MNETTHLNDNVSYKYKINVIPPQNSLWVCMVCVYSPHWISVTENCVWNSFNVFQKYAEEMNTSLYVVFRPECLNIEDMIPPAWMHPNLVKYRRMFQFVWIVTTVNQIWEILHSGKNICAKAFSWQSVYWYIFVDSSHFYNESIYFFYRESLNYKQLETTKS